MDRLWAKGNTQFNKKADFKYYESKHLTRKGFEKNKLLQGKRFGTNQGFPHMPSKAQIRAAKEWHYIRDCDLRDSLIEVELVQERKVRKII